jgi:hypothetical protein
MNHSLTQWVAVVGAIVIAGMSIFQILLATGMPLGHAAFGGENRVLSRKLRLASAVSVMFFFAAFYIILARGGLLGGLSHSSSVARIGIWVLLVTFGVSALANVASRSPWERRLMAPVGLVLALCCLTVALN